TSTPAATKATFLSTWFGANPPAGLQVGSYSGSGVGLSTSGDAVNLFDALGNRITGVSFGASTTGITFDNASGSGSKTLPLTTISALSAVGVHSAIVAVNDATEIGSPGTISNFAPAANTDNITTAEDTAVTFNVLTNDV